MQQKNIVQAINMQHNHSRYDPGWKLKSHKYKQWTQPRLNGKNPEIKAEFVKI
jgi:hypothetical protein